MTAHRDLDRNRVEPSRRDVLSLSAGAAALTLLPSGHLWAQPKPQSHMLTVGEFQVVVISDGNMTLPLSMALPKTSDKDLADAFAGRTAPTAGLPAAVNVVVIRRGKDLLVVDSGGTSDFMPTLGQFASGFEKAGFKAEEVTHVIFTHAHADHLWGVIDPLDDDTRFQNAKHVMSADEMNFWRQPDIETKVPEVQKGMAIGTARRLKMLEKRLESVRPGTELIPGITVVATPGHTPGHVSVLLNSGGASLLVGGDSIANAVISFERPDWHWGPDLDAQQAAATRKKLLDQLAADRSGLLGYHLPWPGAGRVERHGTAYRFIQS